MVTTGEGGPAEAPSSVPAAQVNQAEVAALPLVENIIEITIGQTTEDGLTDYCITDETPFRLETGQSDLDEGERELRSDSGVMTPVKQNDSQVTTSQPEPEPEVTTPQSAASDPASGAVIYAFKSNKTAKKVTSDPAKKVTSDPKVTSDLSAASDPAWKPSQKRPGWLIRRLSGYDIGEHEYGVSYLYVVTRRPKKQRSADWMKYPHAGFFNWESLQAAGNFKKEVIPNEKRNAG